MSITLSELESKSEPELLTITRAGTTESSACAISTVWSTLSLLKHSSCTPDQIAFLPPYLSLVLSSSSVHSLNSIPSEEGRFTKDLTQLAHVTSALLSCSSVLAGLSSDSDQFGDVGILLPVLEGDRKIEIVNVLGLAHWLHNGGMIVESEQTSNIIPFGLANILQTHRDMAASQIDHLISLLSRLHDPFQFRLEGGRGNEGTVICFLLGTITLDKRTAWAGLLGAGTWADF